MFYLRFCFVSCTLMVFILSLSTSYPSKSSTQPDRSITATSKGTTWPFGRWWDASRGDYNWDGIVSDLDDIQRAGITWIKLPIVMATSFAFYDRLLPMLAARNISIQAHIISPELYYLDTSSAYKSAYTAWLTELVHTYQGSIRYWEIHNEPNYSTFWRIDPASDAATYAASVSDYVALLKVSYQTIKAADAQAQVIHGGLASWNMERFVAELIKQNAYQYFDIMGFHPYPDWSQPNPDGVITELNQLKSQMAAQSALAAKPIWITEIGFNTAVVRPAAVGHEQLKADYLVEMMNKLRQNGITYPIHWYTFIADANDSAMTGYDLVRKDPATLQTTYLPAYDAYRDLWPNTPRSVPEPLPATAQTATLHAQADTYVSSSAATSNFGTAQALSVNRSGPEAISYLRFDLQSLRGKTLDALTLRVKTTGASSAGSKAQQFVQPCASDWQESSVTYNARPALATYSVGGGIQYTQPNTWYDIALAAPELQAQAGQLLCLALVGLDPNDLEMMSRETAEGPQLVVTYHDASDSVAEDRFSRQVPSGWGSTPTGGAYTLAGDPGTFGVNSWAGTMQLTNPNTSRAVALPDVQARDVDATVRLRLDTQVAGGSAIAYLVARQVDATQAYRARLRFAPDGTLWVGAEWVENNQPTLIGNEQRVADESYSAKTFLWLRVRVQGANPTSIAVKTWRYGTDEPADWQYQGTDTTARLQAAGSIGLASYLSGAATNTPLTVTFDDFRVTSVLLAADTFSRRVTNGWGTAATGGSYTLVGDPGTFAVNTWAGTMQLPRANTSNASILTDVQSQDLDATMRLRLDKRASGGSAIAAFVVRQVDPTLAYRARLRFAPDGKLWVAAERVNNNQPTVIGSEQSVTGESYSANTFLWLRVRVQGTNPTTIAIKVWRYGKDEPAEWQYQRTDSTSSLQLPGAVGLYTYLSSAATNAPLTATFDDFRITSINSASSTLLLAAQQDGGDPAEDEDVEAELGTAQVFLPLITNNADGSAAPLQEGVSADEASTAPTDAASVAPEVTEEATATPEVTEEATATPEVTEEAAPTDG